MDKAGKAYWDGLWQHATLPVAVNPRASGLNNYVNRKFHDYFEHSLSALETKGKRLLEIGCARSAWLPYFAKQFGFEVSGLDYSEQGCQQAKEVLASEGVEGEISCADFFSPASELIGAFDVVVSFGVAEHFQNTSECLAAFARFLKPGGLLLTNIPNLTGLNGSLQKRLNRPVFDIHVVMSREGLAGVHRRAGLEVITCDYFLSVSFGVVNVERWKGEFRYVVVTRLSSWISKLTWCIDAAFPVVRPNRWTSPYINCLGRKP